jgi:hypothetical protein
MLSFLGFLSDFPVNAFFLFPQSDIEKPTHAALGPQVLKHPERGDGFEVILFYSWSFLASNMCVSILRVLSFFSHFSCGILIFQFVGLFLGFCFFTHFSGGILTFQLDAHIL